MLSLRADHVKRGNAVNVQTPSMGPFVNFPVMIITNGNSHQHHQNGVVVLLYTHLVIIVLMKYQNMSKKTVCDFSLKQLIFL